MQNLYLLRGSVLSILLLYASITDLKKREIPNFISAAVFGAAFLDSKQLQPFSSLLGAGVAAGLFFYARRAGGMGGGDGKLAASICFVLGFWRGCLALLIALILALLAARIKKRVSIPLAPYLGAGCLLVYWIWR